MAHVVYDIQQICRPENYDLRTAEGRRDFDSDLRACLAKIDDESLRRHAGEMIKEWRWQVIRGVKVQDCPVRFLISGDKASRRMQWFDGSQWLDVPHITAAQEIYDLRGVACDD